MIGPRAVIGARLSARVRGRRSANRVLLEGCVVGAGARIGRSILSAGVEVDAGAVLEGAVVGRDEECPPDDSACDAAT